MFLILGVVLMWVTARKAERANEEDRSLYKGADPLLLHIRQDIKLACFLLFAAVFELAMIAEIVFWKLR